MPRFLQNMVVTIQNQAQKSTIFSLRRIRQINLCKNPLMNINIQRIFFINLLGSEQLHIISNPLYFCKRYCEADIKIVSLEKKKLV